MYDAAGLDLGMPLAVCALCLRVSDLQASHITPKFAVRFIKRHSALERSRLLHYDLQVAQDSTRRRMLCSACEQALGRDEQRFQSRLLTDDYLFSGTPVVYEEWMLRFVAGLMFKVIVEHQDHLGLAQPRALSPAREALREYLRGHSPTTRYPLLHACVGLEDAGRFVRAGGRLNQYEHYMTGAVDHTVVAASNHRSLVAVYAHIPYHVFWMPVVPRRVRADEWTNTRLHMNGVLDPQRRQRCGSEFWAFITTRLEDLRAVFEEADRRSDDFVDARRGSVASGTDSGNAD